MVKALDRVPQLNQPYIIFADGQEAVVFDMYDFEEEDKKYKQVMLIPTNKLIEKENIKQSDYHPSGYIVKSYPHHYIFQLDDTPHSQRWLNIARYDGTLNNIFFRGGLIEKSFINEITALQNEIHSLKAGLARAEEDRRMMLQHPDAMAEAIRDEVKKMLLTSHAIREEESKDLDVTQA